MNPGARGASLPPSYAPGTSDVSLLGKNIGDNFDRTAAADPAREALMDGRDAGDVRGDPRPGRRRRDQERLNRHALRPHSP